MSTEYIRVHMLPYFLFRRRGLLLAGHLMGLGGNDADFLFSGFPAPWGFSRSANISM